MLDEIEEGESIVRLGTAARECEKKMTKSRLKRRGILLFKKNEWKTKEIHRKHEEVEKEMTIVQRQSNENETI